MVKWRAGRTNAVSKRRTLLRDAIIVDLVYSISMMNKEGEGAVDAPNPFSIEIYGFLIDSFNDILHI